MLNSMHNTTYCSTYNHPVNQNPPINNTVVHDQFPPNSSHVTSNIQYLQSQHIPLPQQQTLSNTINPVIQNQIRSSNFGNTNNQQLMYHHPYCTSNHHQQINSPNVNVYSQRPATSSHTNNIAHHVQNEVIPMESDNGDKFIQVNNKKSIKKKKRAKINPVPIGTPDVDSLSPSTSTSSNSTDKSTSSTNSDSIVLNVNLTSDIVPKISRTQTTVNENIPPNSNCETIEISEQARRFAETRFAFPPFVIKFNQAVDEKTIIKSMVDHFLSEYKMELNFAGHRLKNKNELLLFSANRETFIMLFDEQKWPTTIDCTKYEKTIPKHLPPQFSIVLRNVPIDIEINSLLTYIKTDYPDILNAVRITGKNSNPSSLVRLDVQNISVIDKLLSKKFIYYEKLRIPITEYLAPAKVLVCTKCFEIGHFRSACKSDMDRCRKCGVGVPNIKLHRETCTDQLCCVRCRGAHEATDVRCPNIKTYRTLLTKSLLSTAILPTDQQTIRPDYHRNDVDFPVLNGNSKNIPYRTNNLFFNNSKKMDEMYTKIEHLDDNMNRLIDLNNKQLNQITSIQQLSMKHDNQLRTQQADISFQHDFLSQFISPICQVLVEIIPILVQQNTINDKTMLCPSLTALCEKLSTDLPVWTNRFVQNENIKAKLINEFNAVHQSNPVSPTNTTQLNPVVPTSSNVQLPSHNQ